MVDPFPNVQGAATSGPGSEAFARYEKFYSEAQGIDDGFAYDERYFNLHSPPEFIYKPSKVIMRKLMRCCASCSDFSDLYFLM